MTKYILCGFVLLALVLGSRLTSWAQNVTYDEILHAASHPEDWLTYGGNYSSQRFSELKQVDSERRLSEDAMGLSTAPAGDL